MAGREGFEPPEVLPSTVFKTAALSRSAISRQNKDFYEINNFWRRHPDSNRGSRLCRPMPYRLAISPPNHIRWCPEPDLNRHRKNSRGILSPLRLPISPSGRRLTFKNYLMERETRFELATPTLARLCSTTELFPHFKNEMRV